MRIAAIFGGMILCSALLIADEHKVDFDSQVEFSKIRTFKIGGGKIAIEKPEIKNSLVLTKIKEVIRTALTSKGLKETADRPDVIADFVVSGQDYSVSAWGVTRPIEPARGRRGTGDSQGCTRCLHRRYVGARLDGRPARGFDLARRVSGQ